MRPFTGYQDAYNKTNLVMAKGKNPPVKSEECEFCDSCRNSTR